MKGSPAARALINNDASETPVEVQSHYFYLHSPASAPADIRIQLSKHVGRCWTEEEHGNKLAHGSS